MSEIKKSSAEWSTIIYGQDYPDFLMDPDGWDRKNFQDSWNEPITVKEYQRRFLFSTVLDGSKISAIDDYIRNIKKLWFRLSPELVDGEHWTPVETPAQVVDAVKMWCSEMGNLEGESFTVEVIALTQEEFDALPEI